MVSTTVAATVAAEVVRLHPRGVVDLQLLAVGVQGSSHSVEERQQHILKYLFVIIMG